MEQTTVSQLAQTIIQASDNFNRELKSTLLTLIGLDKLCADVEYVYNKIPTTSVPLSSIAGISLIYLKPEIISAVNASRAKPLHDSTIYKAYASLVMGIVSSLPDVKIGAEQRNNQRVWYISSTNLTEYGKGLHLPDVKPSKKLLHTLGAVVNNHPKEDSTYLLHCTNSILKLQFTKLQFNHDVINVLPYPIVDLSELNYAKFLAKAQEVERGLDNKPLLPVYATPTYDEWKQEQIHNFRSYKQLIKNAIVKWDNTFYNNYAYDSRGRIYVRNDLGNFTSDLSLRGFIEFNRALNPEPSEVEELNLLLEDIEPMDTKELYMKETKRNREQVVATVEHYKALSVNTDWYSQYNIKTSLTRFNNI